MRIVHEIFKRTCAYGGGELGSPYRTLTFFSLNPLTEKEECIHLEGSLEALTEAIDDASRVLQTLRQIEARAKEAERPARAEEERPTPAEANRAEAAPAGMVQTLREAAEADRKAKELNATEVELERTRKAIHSTADMLLECALLECAYSLPKSPMLMIKILAYAAWLNEMLPPSQRFSDAALLASIRVAGMSEDDNALERMDRRFNELCATHGVTPEAKRFSPSNRP